MKKGFSITHLPPMPISMYTDEEFVEQPGLDVKPTVHMVRKFALGMQTALPPPGVARMPSAVRYQRNRRSIPCTKSFARSSSAPSLHFAGSEGQMDGQYRQELHALYCAE